MDKTHTLCAACACACSNGGRKQYMRHELKRWGYRSASNKYGGSICSTSEPNSIQTKPHGQPHSSHPLPSLLQHACADSSPPRPDDKARSARRHGPARAKPGNSVARCDVLEGTLHGLRTTAHCPPSLSCAAHAALAWLTCSGNCCVKAPKVRLCTCSSSPRRRAMSASSASATPSGAPLSPTQYIH